ncbi:MAG: 4Fe-4S binding protein [Kiritimatiellae bacterium]|nr:4Fe-4S binding protein [Kiritimatiellia bacterium]
MRSLALAGVALPFLPFAQWPTIMAGISAISPFVSLSAAMGSRHPAWLGLLGLPLVILAIFKRRWFCWHLCPTGFILELAAFRRRAGQQPPAGCPHIGKWLLITGIGMAAAGYPLLTILDPLQILSGFFNALRWKPNEWKVFAAAIPFLALLILNFLRPNVWCRWLCPLGAAQQFLGTAGSTLYHHLDCCRPASQACGKTNSSGLAEDIAQTNEIKPAPPAKGIQRRVFLMTCLGGIAGWAFTARKTRAAVVRPPGAVREDIFTGLCARCGNCINVCPENIIVPDFGASGLRGLLTPVLKYDRGHYCNEWCAKCLRACPTSAIRRFSPEQKRLLAIGTAHIDKSLCLAWNDRQDCMVCQEFCPYQAVSIVKHEGVNCPEVREEICRGCGACESQCPALPARAIIVRGKREQSPVKINQNF